jgi:hypothetical protein
MENIKKLHIVAILILISLVISPVFYFQAKAQNATIWVDKADYHIGETVRICGTAFQPNHNLAVNVTTPINGTISSFSISSDSNGNFTATYLINIGGIPLYEVTATDGTNKATTTFTDCNLSPPTCTVTINPTLSNASQNETYVIQISNLLNTPCGYSSGLLKCANITIPSGFSNVNVLSANHYDFNSNLISKWNYNLASSQILVWEGSQGCDDVSQGQYVNVTFFAQTPTKLGIYEWTSYVYSNAPASCPFLWPTTYSLGVVYGSQPTVTVSSNSAGASQLEILGGTSQVAGTPFILTVKAEDSCGNIASGYTGTIHFSSSDSSSVLPNDYTFLISDSGMQTFTVTLKTAGSQSISITDTVTSTITGSLLGITVAHASADSIKIFPAAASITAGNSITYTAKATDAYFNTWDITDSVAWSISNGAGGSWIGSTYTSEKAGVWTVTGTYFCQSATASLTVTHAIDQAHLDHIIASVNPISVEAPNIVTGMATAFDTFNNSWGISTLASWSIPSGGDGGSWAGNIYTSHTAGIYIVQASYLGKTAITPLTVTHSSNQIYLDHITIVPKQSTVPAGISQSYTATAYDKFGNSWSVTAIYTCPNSNVMITGSSVHSNIAGTYTITGTYNGKSDTAILTVTPNTNNIASLAVTPKTQSIAAGNSIAYTTIATDIYGNTLDVSSNLGTSWTINASAGGFWTGPIYTSAKAGFWVITATYGGKFDTASLTVTHATDLAHLDHITASVNPNSVAAPGTATGTAIAYDSFGNSWDVSVLAVWSIPAGGDGGSWSGNVYTSHTAGTYIIQASYFGKTATISLTVTHATDVAYLDHISIAPKQSTIVAGNSQPYIATAYDTFGNNWIVTAVYTCPNSNLTISGSSASSNVAGVYTVTGTFSSKFDTASLTVTANSALLNRIVISPKNPTISAGSSQSFTVEAFDLYGNSLGNVTANSIFKVNGVSITGNSVSENSTGSYNIVASYNGLTDSAILQVNFGPLDHIAISPNAASIIAGNSQIYATNAFDAFGNTWTVTTSFSISIDAGGSWSGNVYTSAKMGTWAITGTYLGHSAIAQLTVNHAAAISVNVIPASKTLTAGTSQTFSATAVDSFGNSWLVSDLVIWSIDVGAGGFWSGATYTSANPGSWTVKATLGGVSGTANLIVNALYYKITVIQSAHGTINPGTVTVEYGTSQSFSIKPDTGYHIASIIANAKPVNVATPSGQSYNFGPVTADGTLTATFAINTYTVTVHVGNHGSSNLATETVNWGTKLNFVFTPDTGYTVAKVAVNTTSVAAVSSLNMTITGNTFVNVSFAFKTYTISVIQSPNGIIVPGTTTVNYGKSQSFNITPSSGYHIASLKVDEKTVKTTSSYTFSNVQASHTITATFEIDVSVPLAYVLSAFLAVAIIIILIFILINRQRRKPKNVSAIPINPAANEKEEVAAFKNTIEKIRNLEEEKKNLMLEIQKFQKTADAKASALENEVNTMRDEINRQKAS